MYNISNDSYYCQGVYTLTKQQQLIYHLILDSNDHPTADTIYWRAKQEIPNISVGTVYRNLNHLAETGIVRRLSVPGEADRFDKTTLPHGHALCKQCGKMTDIFADDFGKVIEDAMGMEILSYELNVSYICSGCKAETNG